MNRLCFAFLAAFSLLLASTAQWVGALMSEESLPPPEPYPGIEGLVEQADVIGVVKLGQYLGPDLRQQAVVAPQPPPKVPKAVPKLQLKQHEATVLGLMKGTNGESTGTIVNLLFTYPADRGTTVPSMDAFILRRASVDWGGDYALVFAKQDADHGWVALNCPGSSIMLSEKAALDPLKGRPPVDEAKSFLLAEMIRCRQVDQTPPAQKSLDDLILDLDVEEPGNYTCGTARAELTRRKDEAVPALQAALANPAEKIRYNSVWCLGDINSAASRRILIDAFYNGIADVRNGAAYALALHPAPDAEAVYLADLGNRQNSHLGETIQALAEVRSQKAIPGLNGILSNPPSWRIYYGTLIALRTIQGREHSQELQEALDFLRRAKFKGSEGEQPEAARVDAAIALVKANLEAALPDVVDIFLRPPFKASESNAHPRIVAILKDAGSLAEPYLAIARKDPQEQYRVQRLFP